MVAPLVSSLSLLKMVELDISLAGYYKQIHIIIVFHLNILFKACGPRHRGLESGKPPPARGLRLVFLLHPAAAPLKVISRQTASFQSREPQPADRSGTCRH